MSPKNVKYGYLSTLDKPLTYQYSKFLGYGFIKEYIKIRSEAIDWSKYGYKYNPIHQKDNISFYLKSFNFERYDIKYLLKRVYIENSTKEKLKLILFILHRYSKPKVVYKKIYNWLSMFIKKYEVSKKIYVEYNPRWEKKSADYKIIENYVLLALNLAIFYNNSKNLKFLNTLLKLNDILCGIKEDIPENYRPLFCLALYLELDAIKHLASKKGLVI